MLDDPDGREAAFGKALPIARIRKPFSAPMAPAANLPVPRSKKHVRVAVLGALVETMRGRRWWGGDSGFQF
eukprot:4793033-Pyramimonas_sp.AAC.1